MTRPALIALLALGCAKEREAAPRTLDDVAHAVFRDFEDPIALDIAVVQLAAWLADEGDSEEAWEGLRLTNLASDDIAGLDVPAETDLDLHVGIGTAAPSPHPLDGHAALIVEPDQTWTDPGSFDVYSRTVVDGDAEAFETGPAVVRTENTIVKSGALGVTIPYELRKDYRRLALSSGGSAVVGRNWLTEAGCSDNDKNCVLQSFGIDTFIASGTSTRRLYVGWLEVRTEVDGLMSEDARIGLIALGNQDIFEATDEELARRGP